MELGISDRDKNFLGLKMKFVHKFITKILALSEIRFWIIQRCFPLMSIDQILDCFEEAQFFSSLDRAADYLQVLLFKFARLNTVLSTTDGGHYGYKWLPFTLYNTPAFFQWLMNRVFKEQLYNTVTIFTDDVLITARASTSTSNA